MKNFHKGFLAMVAGVLMAGLGACSDEESVLGIDLVDSTTLYNGLYDTLYADKAWTEFEDSLLTSNYSFGIIGNYTDATFGKVSAMLYTQMSLPPNTNDIAFDSSWEMDSVVLTLTKAQIFPDTSRTYSFHFEVKQLAEPLLSDTQYYAFNSIPVDEQTNFFDGTLTVKPTDTLIRIKLDESFYSVIQRSATAEEFIEQTKGLRIRLTTEGDEGMISIDFSSSTTCLRAHYHYIYEGDTTNAQYTFLMGAGTKHFMNFEHDYSGTLFASGNELPGNYRLYLEPLGGHEVRVSFDRDLKKFREEHPGAVIHHAELILPVAPESAADKPDQVIALSKGNGSTETYIDDLIDPYTLRGYDGAYHEDSNYFRLRVTQHLQGLLRQGNDPGTLLLLNSRRHTAQHVIFNGTSTTNRPRINIVYSE